MPMALFFRPSIFVVHSHLNLIYQFWIHTEVVDSVGPLEYIINTPSHHRVHHGRNPYCIDKNYAGVLIIWDRIFGTFEPERRNEPIAYGLVHPIETFDPIYIQSFVYVDIIKRSFKAKSLGELFAIWFKGPGWEPGSPRLGFPNSIPEVQFPVTKYNNNISTFFNCYVIVHFMFLTLFFIEFSKILKFYPTIMLSVIVIFVIYNLTCFGWIFDAKRNSLLFEAARCALFILLDAYHSALFKRLLFDSYIFYKIFKWLFFISFIVMLILAIIDLVTRSSKSPKKETIVKSKTN